MASILEKTLVPLWLGAGKSAGNAFLGAPGALIKSFGNEEQPLSNEQLRQQSELFRTSGLALGLPEHLSTPDFTQPEQDFFTKAGNYLLDTNARIQDNVNQARQDFLGDDPEVLSRAMEGLGTMAIPALAGWAGGQPLISAALSGLTEAAAETGNFATDINSQGRFDSQAQDTALKNFLANAAMNAGLGFLPTGEGILNNLDKLRKWTPAQKFGADLGREILEELLIQEPIQRIIEDSSYKSLGENNGFAPNLLPGLNSYPQKLWEIFNGN